MHAPVLQNRKPRKQPLHAEKKRPVDLCIADIPGMGFKSCRAGKILLRETQVFFCS